MTPCQVWHRWTYPLPYYSIFVADTLLYAVTLSFDPVTMTFDICSVSSCDVMKLRTKFEHNRTIRGGFTAISVFDLIRTWTCFKCCAQLWDNFHQVWPSTTYLCLNYIVFWCWYIMSSCDLDLWPLHLELLQHFGCHTFKLYKIWVKSVELSMIWCVFTCNFRGWVRTDRAFSGVRGPNLMPNLART